MEIKLTSICRNYLYWFEWYQTNVVDKKTTVLSIAVGTTPPEVTVSPPSLNFENKLRNTTGMTFSQLGLL